MLDFSRKGCSHMQTSFTPLDSISFTPLGSILFLISCRLKFYLKKLKFQEIKLNLIM